MISCNIKGRCSIVRKHLTSVERYNITFKNYWNELICCVAVMVLHCVLLNHAWLCWNIHPKSESEMHHVKSVKHMFCQWNKITPFVTKTHVFNKTKIMPGMERNAMKGIYSPEGVAWTYSAYINVNERNNDFASQHI